jgi:hypothetical protein
MGYTHHWAYQPSHPSYRQAWPAILADTRAIIDRVRQAGIVIAGADGHRRPMLDDRDGIEFNGHASSDLDCQAFQLLAPLPPIPAGTPTATAFCKTNRNPYDLAVASLLLRVAQLLPDAFALASDGGTANGRTGQWPGTCTSRSGWVPEAWSPTCSAPRPVDSPLCDRLDGVRFDVDPR